MSGAAYAVASPYLEENPLYSMAIDAGTGSVRAVLFSETGAELASASRDWIHLPVDGVPGSMQFDTETNYRLIVDIIGEVLAKDPAYSRELVAISATAMREGIVCLDTDGHEIWACANVDARAVSQVTDLMADASLERSIYGRCGQTFALAAQPRLLWIKENDPHTYDRIDTVLMLSEWVLYRLSGELAMEPTNGSTSGLLNLETRDADNWLLESCGLRGDVVPTVVESGTRIGRLLPELAEQWGISREVAIVVGGGDTQMAAVGTNVMSAGQGLIVGGTFWQQAVNIPGPGVDPDMRVRVNCAADPHLWWAEAIAFHVGTSLRWFRDTFAAAEAQEAHRRGTTIFRVLDEAAEATPIGSYGIIPIFSDTMNYKAWKHASPSFLNLPIGMSGAETRAGMYRALLENAAIVSALNLAMVEEFSGVELGTVTFAGGGSVSKIWARILADVTGLHVQVPVVKESTAAGAALCGFVGAGTAASIAELSPSWFRLDYAVEPDTTHHSHYADVTERWKAAYAPQLALMNQGITTSLWRAPGA